MKWNKQGNLQILITENERRLMTIHEHVSQGLQQSEQPLHLIHNYLHSISQTSEKGMIFISEEKLQLLNEQAKVLSQTFQNLLSLTHQPSI